MRACTLCLAVLDPDSGQLHYATCGHPPPLIIDQRGATRYLPASGGAPLGTGAALTVATEFLGPEQTLVLYSDGLIERPGLSLDAGMTALADLARDAVLLDPSSVGAPTSRAERVCQLATEMLARSGYDDDMTILAAQRRLPRIDPLHVQVPATAEELAPVRTALDAWLAQVEPTRTEHESLDLAVTELLANAVEHAYLDQPRGVIELDASLDPDGAVHIVVTDHGQWRQPDDPSPIRGRGLWLAQTCVDSLRVVHGEATPAGRGTTVTLRRRLRRPVHLGAAPQRTPSLRPVQRHLSMTPGPGGPASLIVSGLIDISTAGQFSDHLEIVGRGGHTPLTIDISGVDLLASAGVRVLLDLQNRLEGHGHDLTLIAASGTPAQTVLDLVGLPWHEASERTGMRTLNHDFIR